MIAVMLHDSFHPRHRAVYSHTQVQVMGVTVSLHGYPVHLGQTIGAPSINMIGPLDGDWRWHLYGKLDVYRTRFNPYREERLTLEEWAERQVEQAPGPVFGWQEPGRAVA